MTTKQPFSNLNESRVWTCLYITAVCLCLPESEPRDAGTDQRSSGIIRLHTIKQIIDRVSVSVCALNQRLMDDVPRPLYRLEPLLMFHLYEQRNR